MENDLYLLHHSLSLPTFRESDQQIVWSDNKLGESAILLKLQDFDLTEEHVEVATAINLEATGPTDFVSSTEMAAEMAAKCAYFEYWCTVNRKAKLHQDYLDIRNQATEELTKTGKVKGVLFLTGNLQKIWLSHYDLKFLEEVS